jgi:hypothetical protein
VLRRPDRFGYQVSMHCGSALAAETATRASLSMTHQDR